MLLTIYYLVISDHKIWLCNLSFNGVRPAVGFTQSAIIFYYFDKNVYIIVEFDSFN